MTGSDDGGFKPHPGDPWHPDWAEDAESGDEVEAPESDAPVVESEKPERKKGKRRGRRGRRSDKGAAESELVPTPTASETVSDEVGEPSEVERPGVGDDPIGVGGDSEEETPRRPSAEDENLPAPAWTSDRDPDPDKLLPVEQPSWVGQTTEATSGIEAVGFEPTAVPESEPPSDDALESPATEDEPRLIGEYGVAGPEEVGDAIAPTDSPAGGEEIEDRTAPVPKKRRRLFGRGKRDRVEDVIEDGFVGSASRQDAASAEPESTPSQFGRPEELPAAGDAYDEWVESEPEKRRSLLGRGEPDRAEDSVEDLPQVSPAPGSDEGSFSGVTPAAGEQPDLFEDLQDAVPTADAEASTAGSVAEGDADPAPGEPVEQGDAGLDDGRDWEGDPGRVPAAWFAEIDEDEVVPPTSAESPETEWPEALDGAGHEGQGAVEPTGLFDIEDPIAAEPQPEAVEPQPPEETVPVPEGYEPWHQAVTDAVEAGAAAGPDADDGTYEYDQPVLEDSVQTSDDLPAAGLPAGFEPFPGGTGMEQFELPEETLRQELSSDGFGPGWVTDQVDPGQMPTEEMDSPFPVGEQLDEQIYASGGTIEHRDLAAAIAEAGEGDTQWQAISAAMPGVETGVVGFDDVAHLGTGGDYVATARSDLGLRVVTGVVLVAMLFGSLFIADVAFAVFVGLIVMLGLSEFYGSLRRSGYLPLGIFGIVGGVGTLFAVWFHGPVAIAVGVLLTSTVTFFFYAFSQTRRDALSNAGLTVLGVGWVIGPIAFVIPIVKAEEHVTLIFAIVAVTAATDVGAFAFGRAWGKSPLAPVLSPNKTAEGLAGGVMLAMVVSGAIGFFELGPFDVRSGLALGAIAAFLAPIGDLAESMIKRSIGIKDMGSILPGHGGVLDRIDAFLFVIPAAWVFYQAIGFLG